MHSAPNTYAFRFNIADIIIKVSSTYPLLTALFPERQIEYGRSYQNFFYTGKRNNDITITVDVVENLPTVATANTCFITYHFQDNSENWRLIKNDRQFIYRCIVDRFEQVAYVSEDFTQVRCVLPPKHPAYVDGDQAQQFVRKVKGLAWKPSDLIYDFLQVLIMHYCAAHRKGFIAHGVGLQDNDGKGLLFIGRSGAGKSTLAEMWDTHSRALVLNDDRIIMRKVKGNHMMYANPWHGEFNAYIESDQIQAPATHIFFIHQADKNTLVPITPAKALAAFMPCMFPPFWHKAYMLNVMDYVSQVVQTVPCFSLGVKKGREIIPFLRRSLKKYD